MGRWRHFAAICSALQRVAALRRACQPIATAGGVQLRTLQRSALHAVQLGSHGAAAAPTNNQE
jgi:hydroxymethylglutaryl-CoA reductase